MKQLEDKILKQIRKLERLLRPRYIYVPRPFAYHQPKQTREGKVCEECGLPRSDASGRLCAMCYRKKPMKRYHEKLLLEYKRQKLKKLLS